MKQKHFVTMLLIFFIAVSCEKESLDKSHDTVFEISPTIEYVGPLPPADADYPQNIPAMRITDLRTKESYTLTLGQIEGFTFEEGFRYVLNVRVTKLANPPIDGHTETYRLLKIVSKEKQE